MSGSGSNAFLDLLRAVAPAGLPDWATLLLAAAVTAAVAITGVAIQAWLCRRIAGRLAGKLSSGPMLPTTPAQGWAFAATLGAIAAYPLAPHVFFADIELGLLLILACLALASIVSDACADLGWLILLGVALLVPVIAGGSLNLIEASRLQSDWFGMGWFLLKSPFALPASILFLVAALGWARRESMSPIERSTGMFLLSGLAATFFFGGFESPLTWSLRRSLGEDPGFLNHVPLADGSGQTRIAIGGLMFQLACAATLLGKTMLGVFLLLRLQARPSPRFQQAMEVSRRVLVPLGPALLIGAALWEWARATLWSAA
ncbi:MAG: hypothetical protein ABI054_13680 [Planctomycetota bacterium]